jgi:hypothetical protein
MNRDRGEGTRHLSKDQRKRREAGPAADDRDGDRPHSGAKSQRTFGVRDDEARRQIRELRSRYG